MVQHYYNVMRMWLPIALALCSFLSMVSTVSADGWYFDPNLEHQVFHLVNEERAREGLRPLVFNTDLLVVARDHSRSMVKKDYFSHSSPSGEELEDRLSLTRIKYNFIGENLFRSVGYKDPAKLCVKDWMESSGHKSNILFSTYKYGAVGAYRLGDSVYITQIYLK